MRMKLIIIEKKLREDAKLIELLQEKCEAI